MSIIILIAAFRFNGWPRAMALAVCVFLGSADTPLLRAQSEPVDPTLTFRTLAVGHEDIYNVFYDDQKGRPVAVSATRNNFSRPYTCPAQSVVSFYRLIPAVAPATVPTRVPVGQVNLSKPGPWLLVMKATGPWPSPVELQVVDDSWAARPVLTLRVVNFSKRHAAVQLGDTSFELPSGNSYLLNYPAGVRQQWIKVAMKDAHGWTLRVAGPQSFKPNTRSTLVLSDALPDTDSPNMPSSPPGILKITLVDPAPPADPALPLQHQKVVVK